MLGKENIKMDLGEHATIEENALQFFAGMLWQKKYPGLPVPTVDACPERPREYSVMFGAPEKTNANICLRKAWKKIEKAHWDYCEKITILEFQKMQHSHDYHAFAAGHYYYLQSSHFTRAKDGEPSYLLRCHPLAKPDDYRNIERPQRRFFADGVGRSQSPGAK